METGTYRAAGQPKIQMHFSLKFPAKMHFWMMITNAMTLNAAYKAFLTVLCGAGPGLLDEVPGLVKRRYADEEVTNTYSIE